MNDPVATPATEYLGDGLYAKHDGFGVSLYTDRTEIEPCRDPRQVRHWVYLEPDVYAALLKFVARVAKGGD